MRLQGTIPFRKKTVLLRLLLGLSIVLGLAPPGVLAQGVDDTTRALIAEGRRLFFTETFAGNGRTCATCHRLERSFALDAAFIATLPANDPLFVAEFTPALAELENAAFLRNRGLIAVNAAGFGQPPVFRAPPPLFNLLHTAPFGLNGDIPTLRDFTIAAIRQHFPQTLARLEGRDFRLPTEAELVALDAFMLSLTFPADAHFTIDRFVRTATQQRGRELFFGPIAKCSQCHDMPVLSTASPALGGNNRAFNTGINARELDATLRAAEAGRTFSTPQLFGVRHTAPFFHNNTVATLHDAVTFYNNEFNSSPAAADVGTIFLASNQVDDIVAFLEGLQCPADGDVDNDGEVTFADTSMVLQHYFHGRTLDTCAQERGDVVAPGSGLTPADARCLLQAALGQPSCLTVPARITPRSCDPTCNGRVGQNIALEAQVSNPAGENLPDIAVQFRLGEEVLGIAISDTSGNVSLPFTRPTQGVFLATATAQNATARFNVVLEDTAAFRVSPLPCACVGEVGEAIEIGVRVTGVLATPLAGILVDYRVDGALISRNVTDAEGRFTILFVRGAPGEFIVTATVGEIIVPFYVVLRERDAGGETPLADAGDAQAITLPPGVTTTRVTLDSSRSSATNGIAMFQWNGTPDPPDVAAPTVTLGAGVHQFALVVIDTAGVSSPADLVTITVTATPIADRDRDGLPDEVEVSLGLDPDNPDSNGDDVSDGDEDADGDGLSNAGEIIVGQNPLLADSNANGVLDGNEDTDNDGLRDGEEIRQGTNPFAQDSDQDSWPDGVEVDEGTNPLDAASRPRSTFMAFSSIAVTRQGQGRSDGIPLNTTVVTPTISLVLPASHGDAGVAFNTILATPAVSVQRHP